MTVEFVGPFETHRVVVDGWAVPFIAAHPVGDGYIALTLDHRFDIDIPVIDADRLVGFIADCIAVAMGYTCHPRADWDAPKSRVPMQRCRNLDGV